MARTPRPRVRAMTADDGPAVAALLTAAFDRADEAALVEALDDAGDLAIGLVTEGEDGLTGVAILSHLRAPEGCLALGPIAVSEGARHEGIGGALIAGCIDWATEHGHHGIFVLGRPRYYTRFGFSVERAASFEHSYPPDFMLACETGEGQLPESGPLRHPPAFAALG